MEKSFEAELWLHDGEGGWHFVTLPAEVADDVRERTGGAARGFGSVPVTVVGASEWATSLFPETRSGSYVLPVKQQVRKANGLAAGDRVSVRIRVDV